MPTKTTAATLTQVRDRIAGRRVVTVDLDATLYDAWACCGYRGKGYSSDPDCTHARADTIALIREVCRYHDAVPVILSWRGGLVDVSRRWLDEVGFEYEALFIPGSPDDISSLVPRPTRVGVQVEFKLATVQAIEEHAGATVVASFDDNAQVISALADHGVWETYRVEHLVDIKPHEWAAGRIGAPAPSRPVSGPSSHSSWLPLPFDAPEREADTLTDGAAGFYDGVEGVCSMCGESDGLNGGRVCTWCEPSDDVKAGDEATLVTADGRETTVIVQAIDAFDEVVVKTADSDELLFVSKHDLV